MELKRLLKEIKLLDTGETIPVDDLGKLTQLLDDVNHHFNSKEVVVTQPDDLPLIKGDVKEISPSDLAKFKRKYKVSELVKLAKANKVKGYSGKNEDELIKYLYSNGVTL